MAGKGKGKGKKATGARRRPALRRKWWLRKTSGGFFVRRRVPLFGLRGNTSIPGGMTSDNTSVLDLGAPVASASGGTNLYDIPFSMKFQLNHLDTYTDISNIADKYKLLGVAIRLTTANISLGAGAGLVMPYIEWCQDHDDNSIPTQSLISQKMGVRNLGFNTRGQATLYCKPVPAPALYNGALNAYSVPKKSPFINSTYVDVPHYGIKGIFRSIYLPGTLNTANISVDAQYSVYAKDLQ